jgi:hypothetical protein
MSASVARPAPLRVVDTRWQDSRDALDIASDIREEASEIKRAGEMLTAFPSDAEERMKARAAARRVIAHCDRLEEIAR